MSLNREMGKKLVQIEMMVIVMGKYVYHLTNRKKYDNAILHNQLTTPTLPPFRLERSTHATGARFKRRCYTHLEFCNSFEFIQLVQKLGG